MPCRQLCNHSRIFRSVDFIFSTLLWLLQEAWACERHDVYRVVMVLEAEVQCGIIKGIDWY